MTLVDVQRLWQPVAYPRLQRGGPARRKVGDVGVVVVVVVVGDVGRGQESR